LLLFYQEKSKGRLLKEKVSLVQLHASIYFFHQKK